jgi:hypothetical protein
MIRGGGGGGGGEEKEREREKREKGVAGIRKEAVRGKVERKEAGAEEGEGEREG